MKVVVFIDFLSPPNLVLFLVLEVVVLRGVSGLFV